MERASQRLEIPCTVMALETLHSEALIIKISSISWIVLFRDLQNPHLNKAVWCISFEQASHIFDGCVDRLKEWKN